MTLPGIRIFRAFGIDVYLHWAWAIIAIILVQRRLELYESPAWAVAEVLALFTIVLLHEFGHALACRGVGGRADHIMLWPLGGVAFVNPPMRPGAMMWSIAAGPLVNVALILPTLAALAFVASPDSAGFDLEYFLDVLTSAPGAYPDAPRFLVALAFINIFLLFFNMLPIYPLDGGKLLWTALWFIVGISRSLTIAAYVGLVGVAGLAGLALYSQDWFLLIIVLFAASQCKRGIDDAKALRHVGKARPVAAPTAASTLACPACGQPPPVGAYWQCECGTMLDVIAERGRCPHCEKMQLMIICPRCGQQSHIFDWQRRPG